MFLLTVTNSTIPNKFQSFNTNEFKVNSMILTICTDEFLSKIFLESDGFSVIESPLVLYGNHEDLIFLKIKYDDTKQEINIFKSMLSGRSIYYRFDSNGNFYCSSHISLLRSAGIKIEENTTVIPEYLMYSYIAPPETFYKNIKRLVAGSRLSVRILNKKCEIKSIKYFGFNKKRLDHFQSMEIITNEISKYLSTTIKNLKIIHGKSTVLLSGGIDSSILFKIFQKYFPIENTYSTGYPFEAPSENIEKEYALSASEYFGMKHKYAKFTTKEYLFGLVEAISIAEEPLQPHATLFHLLFKKGIPRDKNLIICGQGADTIFGGGSINELFVIRNNWKYKIIKNNFLMKLLYFMFGNIKQIGLMDNLYMLLRKLQSIEDVNKRSIEDGFLWTLGEYKAVDWVYDYFNVNKKDVIKHRFNIIEPHITDSIYKIMTILDLFCHIQNIQSIISKLGEKQRKIILFPYTERELVNYVLSIPWKIKLKKSKNVLSHMACAYNIPEFIITRPKAGITINLKNWALKNGPFEPIIPLAVNIINEEDIRKMQSIEPRKAMVFWNILNYAIWKRLCINNESLDVLLSEIKV